MLAAMDDRVGWRKRAMRGGGGGGGRFTEVDLAVAAAAIVVVAAAAAVVVVVCGVLDTCQVSPHLVVTSLHCCTAGFDVCM